MPRRPATFTEADIRRAIRAGRKEHADRIEIKKGDVTIAITVNGITTAVDDHDEIKL